MKIRSICIAICLVLAMFSIQFHLGLSYSNTVPPGHSAAPGESSCASSSCHGETSLGQSGTAQFIIEGFPSGYVPGQTYTLTYNILSANSSEYGFQMTHLMADGTSPQTGGFIALPGQLNIQNENNKQYIGHAFPAISGLWTFEWIAPAQNEGPITFHFAGLAANADQTANEDKTFIGSYTFPPAQACPFTEILTDVTECNDEGNFFINLNLTGGTFVGESFSAYINNLLEGSFDYAQLPVTLGPFQGNGVEFFTVHVIDNAIPTCTESEVISAPDCTPEPECNIYDLKVDFWPCDYKGRFKLIIDFAYDNTEEFGFNADVCGQLFNELNYEDLPILLGPFDGTDASKIWNIKIWDVKEIDCGVEAELGSFLCETSGSFPNNDSDLLSTLYQGNILDGMVTPQIKPVSPNNNQSSISKFNVWQAKSGFLQCSFLASSEKELTIQLLDISGKTLVSKKVNTKAGNNVFSLREIHSLNGIHILSIGSKNGIETSKKVLLR